MASRLFRFATWGIVGTWGLLFSLLIYRHYLSGTELTHLQEIRGDSFKVNEQWYGLYREGRKIGHIHTTREKIGEEYRFRQHVEMAPQQGRGSDAVTNDLRCLSDQAFRVKSFHFQSASRGTLFQSHGEIKDGRMVLFLEKEGKHRAVSREIKEMPYLPLTLKAALREQGLTKGKRVGFPVLDFLKLRVVPGTAEVEDPVPVKAGIEIEAVYPVRVAYPDGIHRYWMTEAGYTLREEYPGGLLAFYETEKAARSDAAGERAFDYLRVPVLRSNRIISEPATVKKLRVRLSGVDLDAFPDLGGGCQTRLGDRVEVLAFREEDLKKDAYEIPYASDDREAYLRPTTWVQSEAPRVREFAKAARGGVSDVEIVVGTYVGRLYGWIRKEPTGRIPSALDVLDSRVGECLGNTVLFTAMARAAGIPCRMVAGLAAIRGYFYFHTWPEVWIGRWVPADPTMGQWPASAARIRFLAGDMEELAVFADRIGGIKIEVQEVL